jgi:ABC-type nitrate/sulfonate/bicarbonate transport system substrate-binding protein
MKKMLWVMMIIGLLFVGSVPVAAETYTIGMLPDAGWANFQVAGAKGFWEQQGVSVKLVHYTVPLELMQAVLQRRFDFIPGPLTSPATFRDAGVFDAVYVGTFSMADYHKYLILKNDLVNKSLKGKTIGIFVADHANRFLLSSYLKTVNTTLADVRLVEMTPKELEANFIHNRVQGVLGIGRGDMLAKKSGGVIVISTHDFYEPHGLTILKQGGLAAIPSYDLKKILRGCVEANVWIQDPTNWDEYTAILKQFLGNPDLSDDQIREFMKQGKLFEPQMLLEHNQQKLTDYFTQFRAFLAAEGEGVLKADVLKEFTYDNVIKNQALIEVLQEYVQ